MGNYSVKFSKDLDHLLTKLAQKKGTTKAEILRRSIAYYAYIDKRVGGNSLEPVGVVVHAENGNCGEEARGEFVFV